MASHHHLHGCCHPSTAATSAVCGCHPNTAQCHNPPPPDPHFLHYHHYSTQPHLHFPFANQSYATQSLHPQPTQQCCHPLSADFQREDYFRELHHHQQGGLSHAPVISSLLHRIAALESSLRHHAASRSESLRDAAARSIQTHFRAFLVRRSRTLRQLKDLASIKSAMDVLKSSVSHNNHLDPLALSHKALHLLLKLDSVKGDDSMIRDGKKSITRELTRFLDFIEGVTVKRSELSTGFIRKNVRLGESNKKSRDFYSNQKMENSNLGRDKRLEDLVNRIETLYNMVPREGDGEEDEEVENPRISLTGKNGLPKPRKSGFRKRSDGIQATVKKNVKFSEDGSVHYIPRSRNGLVLLEDCDSDDGSDLVDAKERLDALQREAEEVGGISVNDNEDDDAALSDDGDDQVSTKGSDDGERGSIYSAPLPVKMETRSNLMDKRKTVKLVE